MTELIHAIHALRIERNLPFRFELAAEATNSQGNWIAFDPSNECSKCPWSHYLTLTHKVVVHTLRCHFIITTKLSKSTLSTRCSN
jgi:hypothetical protein